MNSKSLRILIVLIVALIHCTEAGPFENNGCKGQLDSVGWAKLDKIVDDCYSLFREPELATLAR